MSVNKAILVGRVGGAPDVATIGGSPAAKFRMVTSKRWKGDDGEWKEKAEWHSVVWWGDAASRLPEYVCKGSLVYVEGEINYRESEKDGVTRHFTDIKAFTVRRLGGKRPGDEEKAAEAGGEDLPF